MARRKRTLGTLARMFYRWASVFNTWNILISGNPKRIIRHMVRRSMYKRIGRIGR